MVNSVKLIIMEQREEYTDYPCSGKKYNGEKAIISLTSWKARINTCSKTIYSLLKNCPGFHIVLILSEEEFPLKEKELPENLMIFVNYCLIELLWVHKNYKSFKKIIFTMDKYKNVPIISADDDCVYTCNYANELYEKWLKNKTSIVSINKSKDNGYVYGPWGIATLHPPRNYILNESLLNIVNFMIIHNISYDDVLYGLYQKFINKKDIVTLNKQIKQIGIDLQYRKSAISNFNLGKSKIAKNSQWLFLAFRKSFNI